MIEQKAFLKKYNIDNVDFKKSCLQWDQLKLIYTDYLEKKSEIEKALYVFRDLLYFTPCLHAIKYRIKNEEHVIEKIIRHSIKKNKPYATTSNYDKIIKDFIGLRILHLFKEDWLEIHNFIKNNKDWQLNGKPKAKVNESDREDIIKMYRSYGCIIEKPISGYRSVHYILRKLINRKIFFAEIQVRTLFEEAWGEIDHDTRYPYLTNNSDLNSWTAKLSESTGLSDNYASIMNLIRKEKLIRKKRPLKKKELSLIIEKLEKLSDHIEKNKDIDI